MRTSGRWRRLAGHVGTAIAGLLVAGSSWLTSGGGSTAYAAAAPPAAAPADVLVTGSGDTGGYHLYLSTAARGWAWTPLATIAPGGGADQPWIGQQCMTGDRRF